MDSKGIQEVAPLKFWQKTIVIGSLLFWVGYLTWRVTCTMNWDRPVYSLLFYIAEVIGFLSLFRFAITTFKLRKRVSVSLRSKPTVDVYIPTYNEDPEILIQTIYHSLNMDYPHETYVLDDGRRPEIEKLAREMGAHYITRPSNLHAKAGNLNNALPQTRGEIIVILDADGVARKDFLTKLLGYFEDEQVALVQVPQDFYNLDSFQHIHDRADRQIWHEQSLFFDIIMPGLDYHGMAMCCGSGSLLRRSSLEKIGGFTIGSVTEDQHTTLRLHLNGFKSVYHAEPLAYCLAPSSIHAYVVQRARWALGTIQMVRQEWKSFFLPGPLSLVSRFIYASPIYYFTSFQKVLYLMAPFLFLTVGISPFVVSDWFVIPLFANLILSVSTYKILARGRSKIVTTEVFFLFVLPAYMKAVILGLIPVSWPFKVTPKRISGGYSIGNLALAILVAGASLVALNSGVNHFVTSGYETPLAVAGLFAAINGIVAIQAFIISRKKPFSSEAYSFFDYRPVHVQKLHGISLVGNSLGIATAISEKSLSFIHLQAFPAGARLTIELDLPASSQTLETEVISSRPCVSSGQEPFFRVELRFVDLSQESRMELIRYFFEDATPRAFSETGNPFFPQDAKKLRKKQAEQRQHARIPTLIPVFISPNSSDSTQLRLGLLVDLSSSGARIKLPSALDLNSRVQVQIPWMGGSIAGKVVRCTKESSQVNPPCDIGIVFERDITLTPRQLKSIEELKANASALNLAA